MGLLAGASSSAAASSLAGDIGLVRGGSSTNRPTAAAEGEGGEGGRKTGGYAAVEKLLDTERKR